MAEISMRVVWTIFQSLRLERQWEDRDGLLVMELPGPIWVPARIEKRARSWLWIMLHAQLQPSLGKDYGGANPDKNGYLLCVSDAHFTFYLVQWRIFVCAWMEPTAVWNSHMFGITTIRLMASSRPQKWETLQRSAEMCFAQVFMTMCSAEQWRFV